MKKYISIACFATCILFYTSCEKDSSISDQEFVSNKISNAKSPSGKVSICKDGKVLNISVNALTAHLNNGAVLLIDNDGDGYFANGSSCGLSNDCNDNDSSLFENCPPSCDDFIQSIIDELESSDKIFPDINSWSIEGLELQNCTSIQGKALILRASYTICDYQINLGYSNSFSPYAYINIDKDDVIQIYQKGVENPSLDMGCELLNMFANNPQIEMNCPSSTYYRCPMI